MGDFRTTRWLTNICDETFDDERYWIKLVEFLEKELRVQQQKLLFKTKHEDSKDKSLTGSKSNERGAKRFTAHVISNQNNETNSTCIICGESDHVHTIGPGGMKLVQYFTCKRFVNMTAEQRFLELRAKGLCFQCLFPGANSSQGKHKDGKCQYDYVCNKHPSHAKYPKKKHVLVCHEHTVETVPRINNYFKHINPDVFYGINRMRFQAFSKDIKLSFHISSASSNYHLSTSNKNHEDVIVNKAIYQLQTIKVCNGMYATMTGVCLDQITSRFPQYPLQGKLQQLRHTKCIL